MKTIIIQLLFFSFSSLVAYGTLNYIDMKELRIVLSTLQNISAAVFTLAGIWIAYIYPEAISAFTNPRKISLLKGTEKTKRIENLVLIILTSAFVIISILFINVLTMLLKNTPFVINNRIFFNGITVAFVLYLSLNQTKAIMSVMLSNVNFVNELHKNKTENEANNEL